VTRAPIVPKATAARRSLHSIMRTSEQNKTCRAAVFVGAGRPLELREFSVPAPAAKEALVRVECCTLCGSDLHTISGARQEPIPSILGHEILGTVAEVGQDPLRDLDGVPLKPGDRVTWSTSISCGQCDRCTRGLPQKCRSLAKYGHERAEGRSALSGGLAEYLLLRPGSQVLRVDATLSDELLCPVNCATATVAAAFRTAGPVDGARVLIFGAGLLGLTAAAFAKTSRAASVTVCDQHAGRLERAARFGADGIAVWDADFSVLEQRLRAAAASFDALFELSGSPDAVEAACRLGDVGAKIVLVGSVMKSRPVPVDPEGVVRRWLSIFGVHNYVPDDLRRAVAFLHDVHSKYPFDEIVERSFPLAKVNEAFEYALEARPVRVAVRP